MPLKLIPPRKGKSPNWTIRGTYLGIVVDRSSGTPKRTVALRALAKLQEEIERGEFAKPGEVTFAMMADQYELVNGNDRRLPAIITHFKDKPISAIDQATIDACALALHPNNSAATRNREVYTPISAVLKYAGADFKIRRPKGSRGRELSGWLWPEEARRLIDECCKIDAEFGILAELLCYTGMRLSEALDRMACENIRLVESFVFVPRTKNGEPRPVFLPPNVVAALANHPRGLDRKGRVFRFHKGGRIYTWLSKAAEKAAVALPDREAFHIFRHTYGTWMRRYAGSDTKGLVATGAWKSEQSASRYAHTVVSEEAMKATLLPSGKSVEKRKPARKG